MKLSGASQVLDEQNCGLSGSDSSVCHSLRRLVDRDLFYKSHQYYFLTKQGRDLAEAMTEQVGDWTWNKRLALYRQAGKLKHDQNRGSE